MSDQQHENLAAVLYAASDMRMTSREMPLTEPEEVLVRIKATGLCGSDLHYFQHGRNGDFALAHPMCLGHESSGEVVRVGSNVESLYPTIKVGSRVVIEPGRNCSTCSYCLSGRYNLCTKMRFASSAKTSPHLDGTLQQYIAWPARLCHLLPDNIDYEVGALIEPLAVVLQAISRTQFVAGQSVLVMGVGAVGLLACAAAKACGATFVGAVDISTDRLDFGKRNGWIDEVYCLQRGDKPATLNSRNEEDKASIQRDRRQTEEALQSFAASSSSNVEVESGFDVVYECTGVSSCINMSILACKTGGKVGLIGMGHPIVTLALGAAALREVDIVGVFRYANMFPKAIKMLSSGALCARGERGGSGQRANMVDDFDSKGSRTTGGIANLISHRFPLQSAMSAFQTLGAGKSSDGRGVIKVFVTDED